MAYTTYKRPRLLTIICVIGFAFRVLLSMGMLFSPETRKLGDFFPALFGLLVAFLFISYVGIWHMKRWGVELLMITFTANVVKGLLLDDLGMISTVWDAIVITILVFYYRKMDRNL